MVCISEMIKIDPELEGELSKMTLEDWEMDSSQQYAIVSQIVPEGTWKTWGVGAGAAVVAFGLVLAPFTGGSSAVVAIGLVPAITAGGAAGGLVIAKMNPDGEYVFIPPTLYSYEKEVLRGLNIYEFAFAP